MAYNIDDVGSVPYHSLLATIWACFSAASLLVALRTVIRLRVGKYRLSAEDHWMFLALACLCAQCVLETLSLPSLYYLTAVLAGNPASSSELIDDTETYLRYEFPTTILFWSVLWCVKAGFLALYAKLFKELRGYRRVWYALVVFTLLAYAGCIVTLCLSCHPIGNFFKFAQCASDRDVWASNFSVYFSTVVDVFTDLCIMAMPLRLIYNVKISPKQKLGLVCVFGLGFVMIAISIVRAKQVLVQQAFVNLTLLMLWSTLAATISVIVGSLPALKILITTRRHGSSRYGGGSSGTSKLGSVGKPHQHQPYGPGSGRRTSVALAPMSGSGSASVSAASEKSGGGRTAFSPVSSVRGSGGGGMIGNGNGNGNGLVNGRRQQPAPKSPDPWDSQEEMLAESGSEGQGQGQYVLVKHDVTVSYRERERPAPVYTPPPARPGRLPITELGQGNAF